MSAKQPGSLAYWLGGIATGGFVALAVLIVASEFLGKTDQTSSNARSGAEETDAVATSSAVRDSASGPPSVSSKSVPENAANGLNASTNAAPVQTGVAGSDVDGASADAALAPRLHEVRIEADGLAVIAGNATPGADVVLRADGFEVARTAADESGAFATIAMLNPSKAARILTLTEIGSTGNEIASPDELILAPVDGPAAPPVPDPVRVDTVPDPVTVAAAPPRTNSAETPNARTDRRVVLDPPPGDATVGDDATLSGTLPATAALRPAVPPETSPPTASTELAARALPAADDTAALAVAGQAPAVVSDNPTPAAAAPAPVENPKVRAAAAAKPRVDRPAAAVSEAAEQPGRVAVLRSNEDGVQVIRPPSLSAEAVDQIALDSIGYSSRGDVQLQGRAQDQAREVRVYLDNRAIAALPVDTEGAWRGALPDIDSGIYTLRIDEIDAGGAVTSRVETPFKREDASVLAAATANATAKVAAITVQKGHTLWAIARDRYGEGVLYVRVFEANRDSIRDPDLIYPGQIFSLPSD